MPIRQLDRAAIRREARELIRTARVSPIKFTLLFLAVSLALSLLDTALTSLTGRIVGVAFVSVSFASILIGLITQVLDAGYKCYCLGVHRREIARRAEQRAVAAVRDDELRRLPLPGFGEIRESQQRTDVFEVFADQSDLHNFTPYWAVAATA